MTAMTAPQPQVQPSPASGVLRDYWQLSKPRVTLLVIFPALCGMYLAPGVIDTLPALAALLGTVLVVASANVLNCYLERDSDRFMSRTAMRPLPAGRMVPGNALGFGVALLVVGAPMLVWAQPLTAGLALAAHVLYVAVYTPLKRVTAWSTVVGFAPGAVPALLGWTAVTGALDVAGMLLFAVVFVWQMPHTLAIGLFRGQEYAAAGVYVVPNTLGQKAAAQQVFFTSLLLLPVTVGLWALGVAGLWYLLVAGALGVGMVGLASLGLKAGPVDMAWARRVFFFSMAYLSLLYMALAADKTLPG